MHKVQTLMISLAVVMMIGIVVNNAILLLDYTAQLRAKGMGIVGMAIGLVLILGAVTIYASGRQNFRTFENIARIQDNGRHHLFSPFFIINSHHSRFEYTLNLIDDRLNLFGGDILSARNDNVFDSIREVIIPILIDVSQITGFKPVSPGSAANNR